MSHRRAEPHGDIVFPHDATVWVAAAPAGELEKHALHLLTEYLGKVFKQPARVVRALDEAPSGAPAISLVVGGEEILPKLKPPAGSTEAFALATVKLNGRRVVRVAGAGDPGLKRAVQRLVIQSRQEPAALVIPRLAVAEKPWIPEREWANCGWAPWFVRGQFANTFADNRMNPLLFSREQLVAYVDIFDWFGFSGVQLLEMCSNYHVMGSPEAFQDRLKIMALRARENGQTVSLWMWAAAFLGYGWVDPEVTYTPAPGRTAFDDPRVRAVFEKYYNLYANHAPYVDRIIGHFYDPGFLKDREDVFRYMRLLEQKFKAKNPKIRAAIDFWAAGHDYMRDLVRHKFADYLLLFTSRMGKEALAERCQQFQEARKHKIAVGIWGWYDTEMENDQVSSLYVNPRVMKQICQEMRNGPHRAQPIQYWSEMEAGHINNFYTMYAAGQLLWNPDRDPDELLAEITGGIWGPVNGPKVQRALRLIEDARSGPSWETFHSVARTGRFYRGNATEDLRRAREIQEEFRALKIDPAFVPKFPLPFPPEVLLEMLRPHLEQIRLFAEFDLKVDEIRTAARGGAHQDQIKQMAVEAWQPVPEFNTWVGTYGNLEMLKQNQIIRELEKEFDIEVPDPHHLRYQEAHRLLECIQNAQRQISRPFVFKLTDLYEFHWSEKKLRDRFAKLFADGVIEWVDHEKDTVRLVNWQAYASPVETAG